jgi:hypothetical protein
MSNIFDKAVDKVGEIGIGSIRKILDLWRGAKSDSLIDYTQVARVEPIVLIDTDCLYLDSLPDIQQSLLSIFAGYYLQAVAISTTVGKIEVMRHLDKLNPRRNPGDSAANTMGWLLAEESYRHCLPSYAKIAALESIGLEAANAVDGNGDPIGNISAPTASDWRVDEARHNYEKELSLKSDSNAETARKNTLDAEATARAAKLASDKFEQDKKEYGETKALANLKYDLEKAGLKLRKQERKDKLSASEIGFGRDTMKDLKELANLSVGKMFSVEITDGLHKASILVSIRLMASSLPSANLVHILSIGSQDNSAKERYHSWKSGRLEFVKDLILCQDLIDAHRKNLMADKDGIYTNLIKRARGNQIATVLSANPSVATSSNIIIMSANSAEKLEMNLNGKLSNHTVRDKVMKVGYIMILCVVDEQWGRITMYHRGIPHATEVSFRDIKAANSKEGISVSEVMKAYQMSSAPSL